MDPPGHDADPADQVDAVQAAAYALHRYADRFWAQLGHPPELKGPLGLLLRNARTGACPRAEWWAALERFFPPAADWGAP
jgi:hypothetical protein